MLATVLVVIACLSVRPSVTSRYCIKTAEPMITQTNLHDSSLTLVSWSNRPLRNSDEMTLNSSVKWRRWGWSKLRYSTGREVSCSDALPPKMCVHPPRSSARCHKQLWWSSTSDNNSYGPAGSGAPAEIGFWCILTFTSGNNFVLNEMRWGLLRLKITDLLKLKCYFGLHVFRLWLHILVGRHANDRPCWNYYYNTWILSVSYRIYKFVRTLKRS